MILGLVLAGFAPDGRRLTPASLLLFASATLALSLFDQQRLQPWAYQFMLVAVVLALSPPQAALGLLRLLVISFYFHSAITKFDYSFLHTLGQQFLAALGGHLRRVARRLERVRPARSRRQSFRSASC